MKSEESEGGGAVAAQVPPWINVVSSCVSGIVSRIAAHPIDTIKARMQTQSHLHRTADSYGSTYDAVRKILRSEGVAGFYRGLGVALLFAGPAQALYLTSYDWFKALYSRHLPVVVGDAGAGGDAGFLVHFLAGFSAEAFSCIVWVPHDVLKERLQVERNHSVRVGQILAQVRADGWRELYKGYGVTLATFGPFSALYFLCYERMKTLLLSRSTTSFSSGVSSVDGKQDAGSAQQRQLSSWQYLVAAFVAAGTSACLTTPLDVVKTRIQVQRRRNAAAAVAAAGSTGGLQSDPRFAYQSALDACRKMLKYEGPSSFFKGVTARVAYQAPNLAIIMTTYELLRNVLQQRFSQDVHAPPSPTTVAAK